MLTSHPTPTHPPTPSVPGQPKGAPLHLRRCTCGALAGAVPKAEIHERLSQIEALDAPADEKCVLRILFTHELFDREMAAVAEHCVCEVAR